MNVPDTLLMQEEAPQCRAGQIENRICGTPSVDSWAIVPNMTQYMAVDMSGLIKIHAGPSTVCLYYDVEIALLTKSQIRSL